MSSLSSQRAALEAAAKEEDSPPPPPSPQNTNCGKFEGMKQEDDCKVKMEDGMKIKQENDDNMDGTSNGSNSGGKHVNNDKFIKQEPMDVDVKVKKEEGVDDVKPKEESMSPTAGDSKADVKTSFPQPIPREDKKKKCSEYFFVTVFYFEFF
jgi:hypothetical protein